MKKVILLLLVSNAFAQPSRHDGYTINAAFTGIDSAMVVLKVQAKTDTALDIPADTVQMVNGKFTFQNRLITPEAYTVTIHGNTQVGFPLYLENGIFTVTGDMDDTKSIVVNGGAYQATMDSLSRAKEIIAANYSSQEEMNRELNDPAITAARRQELLSSSRELSSRINEVDANYIDRYPTSRFALTRFLSTLGHREVSIAEWEEKVIAFTAALPEGSENRLIRQAEQMITTLKSVQVGMPAPDFTMNDPEGNPIRLSDFYKQHKITMIDFWAGWCTPCRMFNPTLVGIYQKYHPQGFGIIGVSFDRTESEWIQAITDDHLTWSQVSELSFWDNHAARLYLVRSIPQNIFVDANGIIIARRLGSDKIDDLLNDFLKEDG